MSWGEWLGAYLACGFAFMALLLWGANGKRGTDGVGVFLCGLFWPFVLLLVLIKLPGALLERFGWVVLCMGRGRDDLSGWGFRRRPPSPPHDLPGWAVRCPWVELQLFKLHRDD